MWCVVIHLTLFAVLFAPGVVAHSSRIHEEYAPHSRLTGAEKPRRIVSNQLRVAQFENYRHISESASQTASPHFPAQSARTKATTKAKMIAGQPAKIVN